MKFKNDEMMLGFQKLGCLAHLMSIRPVHRQQKLYSLALWATHAIAHDNVEIFFRNGEPVGYLIWALLTPETLSKLLDQAYVLHPSEWNEGELLCILDLMLPRGSMTSHVDAIKSRLAPASDHIVWVRKRKTGMFAVYGRNLCNRRSMISTPESLVEKLEVFVADEFIA
ncbi:toxin-activating lysine-acyltransferase [Burkholderia gladioli]|uniref:toxin-activating lysine-acyltransferase n=1 Tax=Burkholderia gladioli TaxID=28095 RepID=UPI001640B369|nr:toxin-activating lysine-acyltransferase [Burkholderia gladioli]